MKVLQLISSAGHYGAESMLLNLICNSQAKATENFLGVFYNCRNPNTEIYHRAVEKGAQGTVIRCRGRIDRKALRQIRWLVRAHNCDIIHAHGYKAGLYGCIAARREGKAIVATCHNWPSGDVKLAAYHLLDRRVLRHMDAVCAVSEAIAAKLISFGLQRQRIWIIPNGIDVRQFHPPSACEAVAPGTRTGQVLGMVARLDLQKGFEHLLKAVSNLRHHYPSLRLVVVGEGPDRSQIEHRVRQLGLDAVVTMLGQRTDMSTVYDLIDIFVLPSLNEGMPMALLEAMAASKPIVATRVGAVPRVIFDGVTGLLVEPDDETALAQAISRLLSDPDLGRQLAQRARNHVDQYYTAEAMFENYRVMYEAVLAGRAGIVAFSVPREPGEHYQSNGPSEQPIHDLAP